MYHRLQSKFQRKSVRKRTIRYGLLASDILVLGVISAIVLHNPSTSGQSATSAVLQSSSNEEVANPVDQVSSADIALTVARLNGLPETTAITNQAQSQAAEVAAVATNENVAAKPQVVETTLKSRADIKSYTTVAGDTIASVAAKFGVSSDSIRWSNNLAGDGVPIGVAIVIPPVNGVVYTVQPGDTADSLAARFNSNTDQILAYNDGEIAGLQVGSQIIIPNGSQSNGAPAGAAAATSGSSFPWGGGAPVYGGYNGYDYGYCTWYAAKRIPVPSNWGNANTWDNLARASGWTVSGSPRVGAVAQTNRGYYGHVAVVESVSPDGSMIRYSDMNGLAGFNRVGSSGWVPINKFDNYIYR